jgi:hypothetical protein
MIYLKNMNKKNKEKLKSLIDSNEYKQPANT